MNTVYSILLRLTRDALTSHSCAPDPGLSHDEWEALLNLASEQEVLPLVLNLCIHYSSLKSMPGEQYLKWQQKAVSIAVRQIVQTNEFLTLILRAKRNGIEPIVLKGIVCRNLYPMPMLRPSVDEDLLISTEDTEKYHAFFISEGLHEDEVGLTKEQRENTAELSYHKENSPTYLEIHKYLFDPSSRVFSELNGLFKDVFNSTVYVQIEDVRVRTLAPTDHLLYLILHTYKHFLYSGAGIRPMCDIGIFADTYRDEINWREIRRKLISVHAFDFTRALLRIIQVYLLPEAGFFHDIIDWHIEKIDIKPLLEDSLKSGLHGTSSMSRLHSSNMTLHAVENRNRGRHGGRHAVMHSLFLPLNRMKKRYKYLETFPFLLPAAWLQRGIRYCREIRIKRLGVETIGSAEDSIRLGKHRIRILEQYNVISK